MLNEVLDGSILNLATNRVHSWTNFTIRNGTLAGPGPLTVQSLNWSGGKLRGSGEVTVGSSLVVSGPDLKQLDARLVRNLGTAVWSGAGEIYVIFFFRQKTAYEV